MTKQIAQQMTRRKLLTSVGMAGAAAALGGMALRQDEAEGAVSAAVYGGGCGTGGCMKSTIAELRACTAPDADTVYYVTDPADRSVPVGLQ